jgi:flagellum-specific ATP synthase
VRKLMAVYARSEDLVRIGAYKPGADPEPRPRLAQAARARCARFSPRMRGEQRRFADCLRRLAGVLAANHFLNTLARLLH